MVRRARFEINHAALDATTMGLADGLFDVARAIVRVAETRAPDAETGFYYPRGSDPVPRRAGQGLVQHGAAMAWVEGKQVNRTQTEDGRVPKKPRTLTLKSQASSVVAVAGFAFPAAFNELGTLHQPAKPFLTPSVAEVVGSDAQVILSKAMERRLRGERSKNTALIAARKAAAKGTP